MEHLPHPGKILIACFPLEIEIAPDLKIRGIGDDEINRFRRE
jgi:hypothetical protein